MIAAAAKAWYLNLLGPGIPRSKVLGHLYHKYGDTGGKDTSHADSYPKAQN